MKNKKIIAPSILSADFNHLEEEILKVQKAGVHQLHVDVMDGHFAPQITFGAWLVSRLKKMTTLPLDVQLMIENPEKHLESFAKAGANSIGVHFEAVKDPRLILKEIKSMGVLAGLAVKPQTSVEKIFPFLKDMDFALVMTVEPGFSGQKMIKNSTSKIKKIKNEAQKIGKTILVEVDGGVNLETVQFVKEADILVAGHAIFKSDNYAQAIQGLQP